MGQYLVDRKNFNKDVGLYESSDEDEPKSKPKRKIGGKTLDERKSEDPMDLTSTRRRLMMSDPNDPLDPENIEKMLEKRMKQRKVAVFKGYKIFFCKTRIRKLFKNL